MIKINQEVGGGYTIFIKHLPSPEFYDVKLFLDHSKKDKIESLKALGYPGAFLISIILNATVLLPVGNIAIIITLGAALNPVFVGLAGGIGAAIGEMSGYMAGYSGRAIIQRQKVYNRLERWVKK